MEQQTDRYNPAEITDVKKERVFLGILGALLFSLAGAIVYLILHKVGYLSSLTGLVTAYIAFFGYGLLSGHKYSRKGMITAAVFSVLMTALACLIAFSLELLSLAKSDTVAIPLSQLLPDTIRLLKQGSISYIQGLYEYTYSVDAAVFYKDLGMSLLFCGLGIFGFVRNARLKVRAQEKKDAEA